MSARTGSSPFCTLHLNICNRIDNERRAIRVAFNVFALCYAGQHKDRFQAAFRANDDVRVHALQARLETTTTSYSYTLSMPNICPDLSTIVGKSTNFYNLAQPFKINQF